MQNTLNKITKLTMALGAVSVLAGCAVTCDGMQHHHKPKHHQAQHAAPAPAEVIMYESETVEMVAVENMENTIMKAKMYTNSSTGGTSPMGYIKFAKTDKGTKMMVDVTDLRPGKDYVMKIYKCGDCTDSSCCASKCMKVKLPMLSIDKPGRLTKTFNVRGLNCQDLANAKIVLTRDGGYEAAWGRIHPVGD
ncbi:MAG: hypothetical protein J6T57_02955 [Alphaproteobacteria bacterium]|nr:hypothetical protein [Alphaproteobacteria bacterium]